MTSRVGTMNRTNPLTRPPGSLPLNLVAVDVSPRHSPPRARKGGRMAEGGVQFGITAPTDVRRLRFRGSKRETGFRRILSPGERDGVRASLGSWGASTT